MGKKRHMRVGGSKFPSQRTKPDATLNTMKSGPNRNDDLHGDPAARYREMSDLQLIELANRPKDLRDAALEALRTEFQHRGLEMPTPSIPIFQRWETQQPVILAQFLNVYEALLAKGQLESAGVPAFLLDDNMVRIDWFISNLLGGVKLAVSSEHEAEARSLLEQPIPDNLDVEGVGSYEQPRCPKCQSLDVTYEALDKMLSYGSAWLGVPIPFGASRWRCHACDHVWPGTQDDSSVADSGA